MTGGQAEEIVYIRASSYWSRMFGGHLLYVKADKGITQYQVANSSRSLGDVYVMQIGKVLGDADTAIFYFTEKDEFCNNQMSLPLTQKIKINNLV